MSNIKVFEDKKLGHNGMPMKKIGIFRLLMSLKF